MLWDEMEEPFTWALSKEYQEQVFTAIYTSQESYSLLHLWACFMHAQSSLQHLLRTSESAVVNLCLSKSLNRQKFVVHKAEAMWKLITTRYL